MEGVEFAKPRSEVFTMEKLINELVQKTGIERSSAEKVVGYLKDNASRLPELLGSGGGIADAAKGAAKGVVDKVGNVFGRHS